MTQSAWHNNYHDIFLNHYKHISQVINKSTCILSISLQNNYCVQMKDPPIYWHVDTMKRIRCPYRLYCLHLSTGYQILYCTPHGHRTLKQSDFFGSNIKQQTDIISTVMELLINHLKFCYINYSVKSFITQDNHTPC